MAKNKNSGGAGGGYISSNSGRGSYRGSKNNSRSVPGSRRGNQRGSGSGSGGGALLWLSVALVGLPVALVVGLVGYLVMA